MKNKRAKQPFFSSLFWCLAVVASLPGCVDPEEILLNHVVQDVYPELESLPFTKRQAARAAHFAGRFRL